MLRSQSEISELGSGRTECLCRGSLPSVRLPSPVHPWMPMPSETGWGQDLVSLPSPQFEGLGRDLRFKLP